MKSERQIVHTKNKNKQNRFHRLWIGQRTKYFWTDLFAVMFNLKIIRISFGVVQSDMTKKIATCSIWTKQIHLYADMQTPVLHSV